jgi:DNA-binding HxlR family transcriptional regulator/putative sterol carrier protein
VDGFRYEQFCPLARAAEIVGERWTLLILRELFCGPQRFSDLRRRLPGLSSSVLSQRLGRLEARGLVRREDQAPPTPAALYQLTDEGLRLLPVMRELIRFGVRHLSAPQAADHLEPEWVGLAMRAFARRGASPGRSFCVRLPDGDREIAVCVRGGRRGTRVETGPGPADLSLRTSPLVLLGMLSGQLDPADAAASGAVELEGDAAILRELPALFDLRDVMTREAEVG